MRLRIFPVIQNEVSTVSEPQLTGHSMPDGRLDISDNQ